MPKKSLVREFPTKLCIDQISRENNCKIAIGRRRSKVIRDCRAWEVDSRGWSIAVSWREKGSKKARPKRTRNNTKDGVRRRFMSRTSKKTWNHLHIRSPTYLFKLRSLWRSQRPRYQNGERGCRWNNIENRVAYIDLPACLGDIGKPYWLKLSEFNGKWLCGQIGWT